MRKNRGGQKENEMNSVSAMIPKVFGSVKDLQESYDESDHGWTEYCWPIFRVVHPTEGLIDDPSYYYCTLEEQEAFEKRYLRFKLREAGKNIPKWLEKAIKKDEEKREAS